MSNSSQNRSKAALLAFLGMSGPAAKRKFEAVERKVQLSSSSSSSISNQNKKTKKSSDYSIQPQQGIRRDTYSLTFGDQAENHVRMQKIGYLRERGFTPEELKGIASRFPDASTVIDLASALPDSRRTQETEAALLVIRKGVNLILEDETAADQMKEEQKALLYDTRALMFGRVVNKHARHNICFGEESQDPNIEEGKGTVVPFDSLPLLKKMREKIPLVFGAEDISRDLFCEGNHYYDMTANCGIGYHGDTERKIVICIRLGESMPIAYQWVDSGKTVGSQIRVMLDHGDLYIMSQKATGQDWRAHNGKHLHLRHAAGAEKYLKFQGK